jgi:Family of unknown function (DUF6312)
MEQQSFDLSKPIVIKTKKQKKKKYSSGLKDVQVIGRRMSKISSDIAHSMSEGVDSYRKASDKSARKKRDGALRDINLNVAKAVSRALRESSDIPFDLAKSLTTRGSRRSARRQIRAISRISRILRIR